VGVSLKIVDLDQLFRSTTHAVDVINDISIALAIEKEEFNRKIYTRYSADDLLSNLPSCDCRKVVGEYNLGVKCLDCGTTVKESTVENLEPIVWMRAPNGVEALINPIFWAHVSRFFARSGFDVIRWICDTNYHPIVKTPDVMNAVRAVIPDRGYNFFIRNFDAIIASLMELKAYRQPQKRREAQELMEMIRQYRHCIFPQYLPLPNKSLLVIEKSNVGTYVDSTVTGVVDAIRTMTSIDLPEMNYKVRMKENRTIKALIQLSDFYVDWYSKSLAGKPGIARKHIYGTRTDFSFRAVISSKSEAHDYDAIEISWGIATSVFRIHLANKLEKMGKTPNEIVAFLDEHAQKYHPTLAALFDEMIIESPYKGIPVILGRNPSLERGSAQQLFITKVKTDPRINTISLSVLVLKSFNADFDGDQVNVSLSLDNRTTRDLRALAPHMSTFDLDEPFSISSSLSQPKPMVSTVADWMHSPEPPLTAEQLKRMEAIADAP
jgi:hypothetical protein